MFLSGSTKAASTTFVPLLILVAQTQTFNIDLKTFVPFHGDQHNTYFGYSVAMYMPFNATAHPLEKSLLVGAPLANRSELILQDIVNAGGLYKCDVGNSLTPSCRNLEVNDDPIALTVGMGSEGGYVGEIEETRSNQWMGATIGVGSFEYGNGDVIVVCAPNYVYHGPRGTKREPTGDCYVSKDHGNSFKRASPCRQDFERFYRHSYKNANSDAGFAAYHMTGHGQCGFSVDTSPFNDVAIGSVGSYYWQGKLYNVESGEYQRENGETPPAAYRDFSSTAEMSTQDKSTDNNYMTYSLKYIDLDGIEATQDYAAAAPRARKMLGEILFWTSDYRVLSSRNIMKARDSLVGDQVGAYYGYAMAAGDINGDGLPDLAVTAPFWTEFSSDKIELGKVYIYLQEERVLGSGSTSWTWSSDFLEITGVDSYGRFGISIAYLYDLNRDGFGDLAIGAPYAGPERHGVVYIFNGGRDGLISTPTQVIHSEDVQSTNPLQAFGWSIAGGVDMDGNLYKDMAVGAYKSDTVVLFKSRPLVIIHPRLIATPDYIKLRNPCALIEDSEVNTQLQIHYCASFSANQSPSQVSLKVMIDIDTDNNLTKRAFDLRTGSSLHVSYLALPEPNAVVCFNISAYVSPDIRDKTSNVTLRARWELVLGDADQSIPLPILDQLRESSLENRDIYFKKSCYGRCQPDLNIDVTTDSDSYILGSEESIDLIVHINNNGQDSYLTQMNVTLPKGSQYVRVHNVQSCLTITCVQLYLNETDTDYVSCEVGNPFPSNQRVRFTMRFDNQPELDATDLSFRFNVASLATLSADDQDPENNNITKSIPLKAVTTLYVTGNSQPPDAVIYNSTHMDARDERGPQVSHKYEIYTTGPSAIKEASVIINWPMYAANDTDYLLYLTSPPKVLQGLASCVVAKKYINPENVTFLSLSQGNLVRRAKRAATDSLVLCPDRRAACVPVECKIHDLNKDQSVIVQLSSFLWMSDTFRNLTRNYEKELILSSFASSVVLDVPYAVKPEVYSSAKFQVPSYFEKYRPTQVIIPFDLKWILIGIGVGLLLLLIIILILWRCGFFKRYRPHERVKVEKQKDGLPQETERLYSTYT